MSLLSGRHSFHRLFPTTANNVSGTSQGEPDALVPLTEFTLFPKLPPELQIKIWKHAIPSPRLVRVNVRPSSVNFGPNKIRGVIRFSTNTTVPGLLGACQTSREAILKLYTTCLRGPEGRMIRLDGNNDILVLFTSWQSSSQEPTDDKPRKYRPLPWVAGRTMKSSHVAMFSGVKHLATPNYVFSSRIPREQWGFLNQFQSLERFIPLEGCQWQKLEAKREGAYLAVCKEHAARLKPVNSFDWRASTWGTNHLSQIRQRLLNILDEAGSSIDVIPATVKFPRAKLSKRVRRKVQSTKCKE